MTRIGFITPGYPRYAEDYSGVFIQSLANHIAGEDHEVSIFVPADIDDTDHKTKNSKITINRIRYAPRFLQYLFYRPSGGFPQLIKTRKPILLLLPIALFFLSINIFWQTRRCQIIHCHWLPTLMFSFWPKILFQKKILVTIRGSDLKLAKNSFFFRLLLAIPIRMCDKIITVSDSVKEETKEIFKNVEQKIITISNGITFQESIPKTDDDILNIIFVGNLVPDKGLNEIMDSLNHLIKKNKKIHLTLIGDEKTEIETTLFEWQEKLKEHVTITGMIEHPEVIRKMAESDLFILPSYSEGRPNVLLEAMGCGLPVIATNLPGIAEIITHENNGLLIPIKDSTKLTKSIERIIDNKDLRQTLSSNAHSYIKSKDLTWEATAQQHHTIYTQLLKKEPSCVA